MPESSIANSIFLIFVGAAVLATVALYARQAMIVAYILIGLFLGPSGFGLVSDAAWIDGVAEVGIMFLLYLLGLNLVPAQLVRMFSEALWVTVASSLVLAVLGGLAVLPFGWSLREALVAGAVLMFSSTIIGVKLLPTTTLHHQRMGQIMISVLLLQDLFAILIVLLLEGYGTGDVAPLRGIARQLGALGVLGLVAALLERLLIEKLIARFDRLQEYLFLLVIAWCLGIAEFAAQLGLSHGIGAFVAGVLLASSPVSLFVADSLRPLRDFFLVLFFFSLGAKFDVTGMADIALAAAALAAVSLMVKPLLFSWLLTGAGEKPGLSREIGARLGQISEFSLFVVVVALESGFIGQSAADALKMATLLTFVVSSYWVVMRYPTPMAISDKLRRD